jgi:hypothetical protein
MPINNGHINPLVINTLFGQEDDGFVYMDDIFKIDFEMF